MMEHFIIGGKMLIDLLVDDISQDVRIQLERKNMVKSKLIDDAESDEDNCLDRTNEEEEEDDDFVDKVNDGYGFNSTRFSSSGTSGGTSGGPTNNSHKSCNKSSRRCGRGGSVAIDRIPDSYIWPFDDDITLVKPNT
jgi:hypothetical protein